MAFFVRKKKLTLFSKILLAGLIIFAFFGIVYISIYEYTKPSPVNDTTIENKKSSTCPQTPSCSGQLLIGDSPDQCPTYICIPPKTPL